ncbi:AraC family transcriptional regulator [Bradyrhizobium sp. 141]|uniref:AraC family transcriptional regulator n=1 Tax=Bradyrhizobium sp. 141 TaxID=2782617 RepID=UPI001FF75EC2|nr:AraC family transcriptional regulator [Bradyrhizobium sp. 141]MCK1723571.1 AraC family transcriptional regulator ligand-binding domain-containing protein [Bradyrhizobium sp. 141]
MRKKLTGRLSSIPTATGGIARLACARLRKAGKDLKPVLADAGLAIHGIENLDCRVKAESQIKILELAATELHDEYFGFRLAQEFELGEIGLVYYVMASSDRLVDALRSAERYCAINNEGIRIRLSINTAVTIGLEYPTLDRGTDRHHTEFWLVTLLRICRALTGGRVAPRQVKLRHLRTHIPNDVRTHLGCMITYAADTDEILFPKSIGSLPVIGAEVHLNKLLLKYADEALGQRKKLRASIRSQVEDQLAQLLPNGKGNVLEVARRLGMSRRTFARALSEEGATFSAVLTDLRQALARHYLREEQLPISEIAWLLGYREVSSFTHAFTNWTGLTPREFRASNSVR